MPKSSTKGTRAKEKGKSVSSLDNKKIINTGLASKWVRFLAFGIDIIILQAALFAIVMLFRNIFLDGNGNLWFLGFVAGTMYFGILESSIGRGQTLGKRLFKIQVKDFDGRFLSFHQAAYRFIIVGFAFMYANIGASIISTGEQVVLGVVLQLVGTLLVTIIVVMFLFNSKKLQAQDYFTRSTVVKKEYSSRKFFSRKENFFSAIARNQIAYGIAIGVVLCVYVTVIILYLQSIENRQAAPVLDDLLSVEGFSSPNIQYNTFTVSTIGSDASTKITKSIIVSGHINYGLISTSEQRTIINEKIRDIVIANEPRLSDYDQIHVVLQYGFDTGFGEFNLNYKETYYLSNGKLSSKPAEPRALNNF